MTDATIVGGLLALVGVVVVLGVGWLLLLATRSERWPSVPGRITASRVEAGAAGSGHDQTYRMLVTYEYEVAGRKYQGHRVAFGDTIWSAMGKRAKVAALVAQYHPGLPMKVFYGRGGQAVTRRARAQ